MVAPYWNAIPVQQLPYWNGIPVRPFQYGSCCNGMAFQYGATIFLLNLCSKQRKWIYVANEGNGSIE